MQVEAAAAKPLDTEAWKSLRSSTCTGRKQNTYKLPENREMTGDQGPKSLAPRSGIPQRFTALDTFPRIVVND